LEVIRRCGFLGVDKKGAERVVWARNSVATSECPTSAITAESMAFLETFAVWNATRQLNMDTPAKMADAILLLEAESRKAE
jgi:hypothetical protein